MLIFILYCYNIVHKVCLMSFFILCKIEVAYNVYRTIIDMFKIHPKK